VAGAPPAVDSHFPRTINATRAHAAQRPLSSPIVDRALCGGGGGPPWMAHARAVRAPLSPPHRATFPRLQ
jgi:hypothetical protein